MIEGEDAQAHIDLLRDDEFRDAGRGPALQGQAQVGLGRQERRQGLRQEARGERRHRRQGDLSPFPVPDGRRHALDALGAGDEELHLRRHEARLPRRQQAAVAAQEELEAAALGETFQELADRGLGDPQARAGMGDGPRLHDGVKRLDLADVHGHAPVARQLHELWL